MNNGQYNEDKNKQKHVKQTNKQINKQKHRKHILKIFCKKK